MSGRPQPLPRGFLWRSSAKYSSEGKEISRDFTSMAYFWTGDELKDFLFKGFNVDPREGLAGVCIGLASSAILYEGLRHIRDNYLKSFIEQRQTTRSLNNRRKRNLVSRTQRNNSLNPGTSNEFDGGGGGDMGDVSASLMRSPLDDDDDYELSTRPGNESSTGTSLRACNKESCRHFLLLFVSTLIHIIYLWVGYILMLSVMTFNVWILVAIAIGIGIGQFVFGSFRRAEYVNFGDSKYLKAPNNGAGLSPSVTVTTTTDLGAPEELTNGTTPDLVPDLLNGDSGGIHVPTVTDPSGRNTRQLTTEIIVHPPVETTPD